MLFFAVESILELFGFPHTSVADAGIVGSVVHDTMLNGTVYPTDDCSTLVDGIRNILEEEHKEDEDNILWTPEGYESFTRSVSVRSLPDYLCCSIQRGNNQAMNTRRFEYPMNLDLTELFPDISFNSDTGL